MIARELALDAAAWAWVAVYAATAAIAVWRARRLSAPLRDARPSPDARPPERAAARRDLRTSGDALVLVRPLAGDEPGLTDRLAEAGGAGIVVFAVGDRRDGAAAAAFESAARLRGRGVEASVVATAAEGPNHKADQLARALRAPLARAGEVVVVADSDVDLRGIDLRALAAPLVRSPSEVDAVWAPPVERGRLLTAGDAASRAVLDASLHSFPLLSGIDARGLVGKLFAIRRDALAAVGGFEALRHHLGEDMELARRLQDEGRRVTVAPVVVTSSPEGRSLASVLARYHRWLLVIRAQRPLLLVSYPLLLAALPLLACLLALGVTRSSAAVTAAALAGLAARLGVALAARRAAGLPFAPARAAAEAVIADVTLLAAAALALTVRRVRWRDGELEVRRGGRVSRVTRDAPATSSRRQEPHEHPLAEAREEARASLHHRVEAESRGVTAHREQLVDAAELALDAGALPRHALLDVARRGEGAAEGDEEVRPLALAEGVAQADGHDRGGASHDARDLRGAGPELERLEGRALAALGEDPEGAAGPIEEPRRVADRPGAVGRIGEIDAEGADAPEEGEPPQVRRVHHRVAVGGEDALREPQDHERVPPRGVVGHEEHRALPEELARLREPRHQHAAERARDARVRLRGEPRVEPPALRGLDHEVLR